MNVFWYACLKLISNQPIYSNLLKYDFSFTFASRVAHISFYIEQHNIAIQNQTFTLERKYKFNVLSVSHMVCNVFGITSQNENDYHCTWE